MDGDPYTSAILCGYFENPPDPDDSEINNEMYERTPLCYLDDYYAEGVPFYFDRYKQYVVDLIDNNTPFYPKLSFANITTGEYETICFEPYRYEKACSDTNGTLSDVMNYMYFGE